MLPSVIRARLLSPPAAAAASVPSGAVRLRPAAMIMRKALSNSWRGEAVVGDERMILGTRQLWSGAHQLNL